LQAEGQESGAAAVGEEAKVANADKAFEKQMQQFPCRPQPALFALHSVRSVPCTG